MPTTNDNCGLGHRLPELGVTSLAPLAKEQWVSKVLRASWLEKDTDTRGRITDLK